MFFNSELKPNYGPISTPMAHNYLFLNCSQNTVMNVKTETNTEIKELTDEEDEDTGLSELAKLTEKTFHIIDISTPETLERDFYAWLKGDLQTFNNNNKNCATKTKFVKDEDLGCSLSDSQSPRSSSSRSSSAATSCAGNSGYGSASPPNSYYVNSMQFGVNDSTCSESGEQYYPAISEQHILLKGNEQVLGTEKTIKKSKKAASNCKNEEIQNNAAVVVVPANANRSSGKNQLGRVYSPGLPLSMIEREQIVELYRNGWKICDISKKLCVTHSCVSKILHRFRTTGSVRPKDAKEGRQESPLVAAIRDYRHRLGMTRQSEIREQLIRDGVCRRDSAPSRSSINQLVDYFIFLNFLSILRTKLDLKRRKKDVVKAA